VCREVEPFDIWWEKYIFAANLPNSWPGETITIYTVQRRQKRNSENNKKKKNKESESKHGDTGSNE
jgi:hypothetical protein